jgi:hypothetical protein
MRTLCFAAAALALLAYSPARADEKKGEGLTAQQFDRVLTVFLDDPHHKDAKEMAKVLIVFTMESPKATVVLGSEELKWIGKKGDDRSVLLFAAYIGGNTRSQLLSGVKQNDRYSGLVALFAVYRKLQDKDKDFKIAEVEELRKLHADGKLLAHVVELEKKMPTKLSPEDQKALGELVNPKK